MTILITDVELISTNSSGVLGNGTSWYPVFSPDGMSLAFSSSSSNLILDDSNDNYDVFIKNLETGAVILVSSSTSAVQGNGNSHDPIFSSDGNKFVFTSNATNLVSGDTNNTLDVFLKDLITGELSRVSSSSTGEQGNDDSYDPFFSPDGTKVAFGSVATNLVSGDTNGSEAIFIKDLITGAVTRVSVDSVRFQSNGSSYNPLFTPDGTKIVFTSGASNLVAGDANNTLDVFIKDLTTGLVTNVTVTDTGVQANDYCFATDISSDGSKVLFLSRASNLVSGDTNGTLDLFVKDLLSGIITMVSTDSFGNQGNDESFEAVFSPDGSKVAFASVASNLVTNDTNGTIDVFIKDLNTGEVTRISTDALGNETSSGGGGILSFSPDGTSVSYISGDSLFGGHSNIFIAHTNISAGIYGTGLADVLSGTDADNIIYGFQGNDTINGLSGNDMLKGGDGDDRIVGHAAEGITADEDSEPPAYVEPNNTSTMFGENGNDTLINGLFMDGGEGNDTITNSLTQISEIHGGSGDDYVEAAGVIHGDDGNDYLSDREYKWLSTNLMDSQNYTVIRGGSFYGGDGNDTIINSHGFSDGGDGDDAITANGTILGGNGNDVIAVIGGLTDIRSSENLDNVQTRTGYVNAGSGNDVIHGASGFDTIYGGDGDDTITDFFEANSLIDADNTVGAFISGEAGNDLISLGYMQERGFSISGGSDNDTIILQNASSPEGFVYGDDGNDWIEAHIDDNRDRLRPSIISLDGGRGNDTLIVHTRADVNGGDDDDLIRLQFFYDDNPSQTTNAFTGEMVAFGLNETTIGSQIDGGAGYDVVEMVDFRVFTAANFADGFGLTNVERLVGNTQDNIINLTWLSVGDINVQGLGGHDIIWSNIGNDTLEGGAGNDTIRGFAGNDTIFGGEGNDFIGADDGNDTAFGDAGNDDIRGGYGEDLLYGGEGDDRLKGNEENDALYGDLGNDKLYGGIGDDLLNGGDGIDELYGEDGNDTLSGGLGNDKLSGAAGIDRLNGGDGVDKLYGGDGDDQLKGNEANDTLYGDAGNDKLYGGTGDDILNGGDGIDELYGEDGNDKMFGGTGADKLSGGNGIDRLIGGEGSDNLWGGAGSDQFVFDAASLSARDNIKDFSIAQGDRLELNNILTGYDPLTSAIADFVKITESAGRSYLSVDANGATGGVSFIQIAQIDGATGMTNVEQLLNDHVLIVTNGAVV